MILTGHETRLLKACWHYLGDGMWQRDGLPPVSIAAAIRQEDAEQEARDRHKARQREEFSANRNERMQRVVKDTERLGPQVLAQAQADAARAYDEALVQGMHGMKEGKSE